MGTTDDGWLTGVADDEHALVISNGATSACSNIPNIVNGPYANKMVDGAVLSPYGIGVRELNGDANTPVVAYVPLSTVGDDTTGGRTAFSAHMPYWTGGGSSWAESQQMTVSWAVQSLTDSCEMGDFPTSLEEYRKQQNNDELTQEDYNEALDEHCLEHRSTDELQVVQTYDEPFHITGLKVTEDHGLDVAAAYPNPARAYDEDPLWQLAWGLGQNWLNGRDCEDDATIKATSTTDACDHNDGLRDLAVAGTVYRQDSPGTRIGNSTIYDRWGTDGSAWAGSPALWNITPGSLAVETHRYDTSDYMAYISSKVTPGILAQYDQQAAADSSLAPTILFAREQRYRAAGIEASAASSGVLTVSLNSTSYPEQTLASMSWAPYRYNQPNNPDGKRAGWEAYPMDEYYATLDENLQDYFEQYMVDQKMEVDADAVAGQAAIADAYYVSMYEGVALLVGACPEGEEGEACLAEEEAGKSDEEIIEAAEKTLDVLVDVTGEILTALVHDIRHIKTASGSFDRGKAHWDGQEWKYADSELVYESLGRARNNPEGSPWKTCFGATNLAKVGMAAGLAIGMVIAIVAASLLLNLDPGSAEAVQALLLATAAILNVGVAVHTTIEFKHEFEGAGHGAAEGAGEHAVAFKVAGLVTRGVIQGLVLWAAWGLSWYVGGYATGSMTWDDKLAETVAWTFTSIILLLISAIPVVGPIIAGVIGALDSLARLICGVALSPEQAESSAGEWLCGGVSGIVTNIITRFIYAGAILPDMDPDDYDRLELANFSASNLQYPDRGLTYGNGIRYSIRVTNTLELGTQPGTAVAWTSKYLWDADHLKHSNFKYEWQTEEEDIHKDLSLGQIGAPGWTTPSAANPSHVYYANNIASTGYIPLPEPGINRTMDLYLSEGYAIPEAECWGLLITSYCGESTVKDTSHFPFSDTLKYDVFPGSLDDFYKLSPVKDGYRLAWDAQFPTLTDADGDGLTFTEDPNDALWDSDGDGLSDQYEAGSSDLSLRDTDHDGLNDYQEAQLGTDPRLEDSDADGLYDCQEVFHQVIDQDQLADPPMCGQAGTWYGGWSFVYGWDAGGHQLMTYVSSDPVDADADADSYPDSREQVYGFHPGVPSQSEILSLESEITEMGSDGQQAPTDNYLAQGATLQYAASVKNDLDAREAEGLLWTEGASVLDQSGIGAAPFVLLPQKEQAMSGSLHVTGDAATGVYSLTQVAGEEITDWRDESGDADAVAGLRRCDWRHILRGHVGQHPTL